MYFDTYIAVIVSNDGGFLNLQSYSVKVLALGYFLTIFLKPLVRVRVLHILHTVIKSQNLKNFLIFKTLNSFLLILWVPWP